MFSKTLRRLALGAALCGLGCGGSGKSSPSSGLSGAGGSSSSGSGSGGASGSAVGLGGSAGNTAGSASGGSLGLGDTLAEGCFAYAMAFCERQAECAGSDADYCSTAATDCPDLAASPGSTRTPAGLKACAEVYKTWPCDMMNAGLLPDCVTPGTRARGERCSYPSQCSSLNCEGGYGSTCGKCAMTVGAGESCAADDVECVQGTYCDNDVTCVPVRTQPIAPNEVCGGAEQCTPGYYCAAVAGAANGLCTPLPSSGQPCGNGYLCADQTYCGPELSCLPNPGVGEACGVRDTFLPSGFACAAGLVCSGASTDPGGERGTCVPLPQAGSPCIVPPEARIEGCAAGLHCDFDATPPTCLAPGKPGAACSYSFDCEAGLDCGCAVPPCEQRTCGTLRFGGEACSPTDLANHCHPAFDCKEGVCTPAELRGVFAKACGP